MKKTIFLLSVCIIFSFSTNAQNLAIKNNLLYDGVLVPNLGLELPMGKKTTFDVLWSYNPFKLDSGKQWQLWQLQPEFRYWFCERFNKSFIGIHALGGEYSWANVKLPFGLAKELHGYRHEGWYAGGGISYGYQWILSNRLSLEAVIGIGYARVYYEKYDCANCGSRLAEGYDNYFGPTKLGITFMFFL